ncbi:hypothetical protein CJF31_00009140 [Rutstroemia sp. NJR-2017a BVV2]|nr:hypothetical protein CJF31_00009140 [Rutstroemia sp. NJR-2017a BVV2]
MIDPEDIGRVGAHLLALEDPLPHNKKRYVLSGPEDITGNDIVNITEKMIGVKVEEIKFKDINFIENLIEKDIYPQDNFIDYNIIRLLKNI